MARRITLTISDALDNALQQIDRGRDSEADWIRTAMTEKLVRDDMLRRFELVLQQVAHRQQSIEKRVANIERHLGIS